MLHLVSERALRKVTARVSVVIIARKCMYFMWAKVRLWLFSHKCQPSDWPLDVFRDFLTSRLDTFPDNTSKISGITEDSTWSHACSPGKKLGREQINCWGRVWAAQTEHSWRLLTALALLTYAFIQGSGNHSYFVPCHSLKLLFISQRIYGKIHCVYFTGSWVIY